MQYVKRFVFDNWIRQDKGFCFDTKSYWRNLFQIWSGRWESNSRGQLGKLLHYHCATPAVDVFILANRTSKVKSYFKTNRFFCPFFIFYRAFRPFFTFLVFRGNNYNQSEKENFASFLTFFSKKRTSKNPIKWVGYKKT